MAVRILPRIGGEPQFGMVPHLFSDVVVRADEILAERAYAEGEEETTVFAARLPSGGWVIVETGEVVDELHIFNQG